MNGTPRQAPRTRKATVTDRAVRVLANSIYKQLQDEGCAPRDIISVSSQLIDLVTNEIQNPDPKADF